MDQIAAAAIPARYRDVLDGIAELEARGLRQDAAALRRSAVGVYSGAWDDRCLRRLDGLVVRASRTLAGHGRARMRLPLPAWSRRRFVRSERAGS